MKINEIDFFYVSMPVVTDEADGSQDALLVRVRSETEEGWGECEASPLVSIAAFVTPMSHGVCQPVRASVLGETIDGPADIARMAANVERNSMDLLQAAHTWSGIEMALWDLLGKSRGVPVWSLLGAARSHAKTPYASVLFGDTPQQTLERAQQAIASGFRAAKFGWGPFGTGSLANDVDHLNAAREGLGPDASLLIDAGQIWVEDVEAAALRLPALEAVNTIWLEEPFGAHALDAYASLAAQCHTVRLAGGEGAHNRYMAEHLITYGKVGFVQIDCGRIGGIGPATAVANYAAARGVTYVNHTFTSHLALSASLQPYAGHAEATICEYPAAPKQLAPDISVNHIEVDANGQVHVPDAPGLGIEVNTAGLRKYLIDVEIRTQGKLLYRTPELS
jgi:L-alanine-DL-glutamate epimerase-like enolase superfamily enzyme